jgi:hypothetical protein
MTTRTQRVATQQPRRRQISSRRRAMDFKRAQ